MSCRRGALACLALFVFSATAQADRRGQLPPARRSVAPSRQQTAAQQRSHVQRPVVAPARASFRDTVKAICVAEDASNALAVASTYLSQYPKGKIEPQHIKQKMVGHIGATTAISRTWLNFEAALGTPKVKKALDKVGVSQAHVVTGPGHGAAAVFALHYLDGSLGKIYPKRYPRTKKGMKNLVADFCKPNSPLPSHTYPGVPSISEGGELGYSQAIGMGAGWANKNSVQLVQIGDKESEEPALAAALQNHNAIYDFSKGMVLPVLHANGLGITSTAINAARSDRKLGQFLRGLGYEPLIVNAEKTDAMRAADKKAVQLDKLLTRQHAQKPVAPGEIARLRGEIDQLRSKSAYQTNATLQKQMRGALVKLAHKKALAVRLDKVARQKEKAEARGNEDARSTAALKKLRSEYTRLARELRQTPTPFIVYREAKGSGKAPAWLDGQPKKGAPPAHQLILSASQLNSADPSQRQELGHWLGALTRGAGPDGLVPTKNTELGRALATILPSTRMRPGGAPMARGKTRTRIKAVTAEPFLHDIKGARGKELLGGNTAIDAYASALLKANPEGVFMLSADTISSNRLLKVVADHGRHTNQKVGRYHPKNSGPRGKVIDMLSEQVLAAMAQGIVNTGKQAIITNYEAFQPLGSTILKQFLKFREQAVESNATARREGRKSTYRPSVPNMVFHLSSLGFAQDHNGKSHQSFSFVNELLTEPRKHVKVMMPAEANSAVLLLDKAVKGKDGAVALVADKQPRRQFLSAAEAKSLVKVGGAVWGFASSVPKGNRPDVVLAASGGYHTDEVLAAANILKGANVQLVKAGRKPINFSTVNVTEPLKLRAPERADYLPVRGRSAGADKTTFRQATFDRLFPKGTPVVYNFGGLKSTAESLFVGRERDVSAHGYINSGTTTTRFDMMVRNGCDRFTLVIDAVKRAAAKGTVDAGTSKLVEAWAVKQLRAHDSRMKRGAAVDPPEIINGVWSPAKVELRN